jgi:peptide chain release factor 3
VFTPQVGIRNPIVGVVGALQFDVIQARLQSEYGIACTVDTLPHVAARWPVPTRSDAPPLVLPLSGVLSVKDQRDWDVLLLASDWEIRYCAERNPDYRFLESR